jgi:hypothetical protein
MPSWSEQGRRRLELAMNRNLFSTYFGEAHELPEQTRLVFHGLNDHQNDF